MNLLIKAFVKLSSSALFIIVLSLTSFSSYAQTNDWDTTSSGKVFYTGGDVGIGVSNPSALLHVNAYIRVEDNSGDARVFEGFRSGSSNVGIKLENADGYWSFGRSIAGNFVFSPNNLSLNQSDVLVIEESGNIGIGTTSPQAQLHLKSNDNNLEAAILKLDNSGTSANKVGLEFYSSTTDGQASSRVGRISGQFDGGSFTDARLSFHSMTTSNTLVETMSLKNGNVGIGTTTPSALLDVEETTTAAAQLLRLRDDPNSGSLSIASNASQIMEIKVGAGDALQLSANNTVNNGIRISADGNVGIGTSGASQKLDVKGDIRTTPGAGGTITLFEADGTRKNRIIAGADENGAYINSTYGSGGTQSIRFMRTGNESMRIDQNGNLGIGTTNPSTKLHVLEETNTESLRLDGASGAYSFVVEGGSNNIAHVRSGFAVGYDYLVSPPSNGATIKGKVGIGPHSSNPDMNLSVYSDEEKVTRFHSNDITNAMTGIRIGRTLASGHTYVDLVNLTDGFGISAGNANDNNLALASQNVNDISIYVNHTTHNVGIGTTDPGLDYKLAVEGQIGARSIKVTQASWADYVFAPSYQLMPLSEVETYISQNQHLPNVPSAKEVEENGFVLEEMDAKLMEKIEELTLYMIEQEKISTQLEERIKTLEEENAFLKRK